MRIKSVSNQSFGHLFLETEGQREEFNKACANLTEEEKKSLYAAYRSYNSGILIHKNGDLFVHEGAYIPEENIFSGAKTLADKLRIALEFMDEVCNSLSEHKKFKARRLREVPSLLPVHVEPSVPEANICEVDDW